MRLCVHQPPARSFVRLSPCARLGTRQASAAKHTGKADAAEHRRCIEKRVCLLRIYQASIAAVASRRPAAARSEDVIVLGSADVSQAEQTSAERLVALCGRLVFGGFKLESAVPCYSPCGSDCKNLSARIMYPCRKQHRCHACSLHRGRVSDLIVHAYKETLLLANGVPYRT